MKGKRTTTHQGELDAGHEDAEARHVSVDEGQEQQDNEHAADQLDVRLGLLLAAGLGGKVEVRGALAVRRLGQDHGQRAKERKAAHEVVEAPQRGVDHELEENVGRKRRNTLWVCWGEGKFLGVRKGEVEAVRVGQPQEVTGQTLPRAVAARAC